VKTGSYVGNDNNAETLLRHSITGIGFQPSAVFIFPTPLKEGRSTAPGTLGMFVKTDQDGEYTYLTTSHARGGIVGDIGFSAESRVCRGWIMTLDADGFTVSTGKTGSALCTGVGPNKSGKTYTYIAYGS
jgi:hypothetical protein